MSDLIKGLENAFGSKNLAQNFYLGITELFYELDIDGQNFVDDFINSYLHKASENSATKGRVILDTGFSKHLVRKYFDGVKKQFVNTEKNYYCQIMDRLREICMKEPDQTIPIKNAKNSFYYIFKNIEVPPGMITPKMILNSFIDRGFVEIIGKTHIRYITHFQTGFNNTKSNIIRLFCDTVERLSGTFLHNIKTSEDSKKRNQMNVYSRLVDEKHHDAINTEVQKILRKAIGDCQDCIDSFEETEDFAKRRVDKQRLEIGASTFFFINKR
ncbi:MAG: hypothetical protein L3J52_06380 [Proteobacteria bacterium]|nr:hypothetical protein [Pseudomonadota bacterium]